MQLLVKTRVHVLLAALTCIACAEPFVGTDPPADGRFYYPGRMAVSPDKSTVYIVNTNFDQRFTAGWISVLDVNTLVNAIASGANPNVAIDPNRMLRVPTLGGQLVLELSGTRAYLPSRSTGLLTTIDITNNTQLSCGDDTNNSGLKYALQRTDCDANHILNFTEQAAPNITADEFNFANYVDPVVGTFFKGNSAYGDNSTHLAIGFLSSGYVAILDPMPSGNPTLNRMIYMGNTASLSMVAGNPNTAPGTLIVSNHVGLSNTLDRGVLYFVDASQSIQTNMDVVNRYNLGSKIGGFEITSLNLQGNTLYLSSNSPDALVALNLGPVGSFGEETVKSTAPIDSSHPTDVLYLSRPGGLGDLVVMPSLLQDTVYFFSNDNNHLLLVQRIGLKPNGQGPFDMVHITGTVNGQQKDYLLVTTFFDHGMSIIDISSPSYSQFQVVGTIHQGDLGVAARFR